MDNIDLTIDDIKSEEDEVINLDDDVDLEIVEHDLKSEILMDIQALEVYKKKTDAAKNEYLKALAEYRANLMWLGAGEGDGMYGNYGNCNGSASPYGGYTSQGAIPSPQMSSAAIPLNQQQELSTIAMNMNQQHQIMIQSPMRSLPNLIGMEHIEQHNNYMQQGATMSPAGPSMAATPSSQQQEQSTMAMNMNQQQQRHYPDKQQQENVITPPLIVTSPSPTTASSVAQQSVEQQPGQRALISCTRKGCPNQAILNPEWDDEYCSSECVINHCRVNSQPGLMAKPRE